MTFPVHVGSNLIGKSKGDIQIGHDFISGIHANIEVFDAADETNNGDCDHWIEDLESTNGTYFGQSTVSLRPRRFYQLSHDRQLRLGRVLAFYKLVDPSADSQGSVDEWNVTAEKTALLPRLHEVFSPAGDGDKSGGDEDDSVRLHVPNSGLPSLDHIMTMAKKAANESSQESLAGGEQAMSLVPESETGIGKPESSYSSLPQDTTTVIEADNSQVLNLSIGKQQSVSDGSDKLTLSPCFPSKKTLQLLQHSSPLKEITNSPLLLSDKKSTENQKRKKESVTESPIVDLPAATKGRKRIPRKAVENDVDLQPATERKPIIARTNTRKPSKLDSEIDEKPESSNNELVIPAQRKRIFKEADPSASGRPKKQSKTNIHESNNEDPVRVAFTGVDDVDKKTKILTGCGAHIVESWSECTHLIADKIKRTTKFLCALSSGKHILSSKWIDACKKSNAITDEISYCLNDPANEKKWKFKLQQSIDTVKERGPQTLFKDLKFLITPSVTPDYSELKEIIEAGGGEVLNDLPVKHSDNVYIVGCKEDKDLIQQYNQSGWKDKVMTNEFILTCSLTQELETTAFRFAKSRR